MTRTKSSTDPSSDTISTDGKKELSPPLGAVIRVLGARAKPEKLRLARGTCILGAGKDCDVVIDNANVSRQHVEIALVPEGIGVRDLGSRNGTFYLGQRFQAMTLAPGARIHLGPVEVLLDADLKTLEVAPHPESTYRSMIGSSLRMRHLFASLTRLEGSLVTVLVTGESGVGKELVARALHEGSQVAAGPLVVVNCGAIAPHLVMSELFGHRRGAFTGAREARKGAFESAHGATLFLDEVGELPLDVQPALLRALESGEIRPVGSDQTTRVRVRLIAATHRDLRREVKANRFREDLYYRLAVVELAVPPLRDRVEDIAALANRFADASGLGSIPASIIAQLQSRPWPGNVRELRNVVQAYAALGQLPGDDVTTRDPSRAVDQLIDVTRPYADQKDALVELFTRTRARATKASAASAVSRPAPTRSRDFACPSAPRRGSSSTCAAMSLEATWSAPSRRSGAPGSAPRLARRSDSARSCRLSHARDSPNAA